MYSFYGNERAICELRMIGSSDLKGLSIELNALVTAKIGQASFHRVTEADFRTMPIVARNDLDHMIHGSFRKLDFLNIQDAGDLEGRAVILDKDKELKEKTKEIVTNDYQDNDLRDKDVVMTISGILICDHLLSLCHVVRMLIIGDGCDIASSQDLVFDSVPNLERVEIGKNCFSKVASFHVQHCPKLRRVFIGDGSFTNCMDCVIESNPELLELQLGGNAGVSVSKPKPNDKSKKTPKGKCPTENNPAAECSTECTDETLSADSPDKKGSSEPTVKLASDFSPVERNE